jgi:hypothetical protein
MKTIKHEYSGKNAHITGETAVQLFDDIIASYLPWPLNGFIEKSVSITAHNEDSSIEASYQATNTKAIRAFISDTLNKTGYRITKLVLETNPAQLNAKKIIKINPIKIELEQSGENTLDAKVTGSIFPRFCAEYSLNNIHATLDHRVYNHLK